MDNYKNFHDNKKHEKNGKDLIQNFKMLSRYGSSFTKEDREKIIKNQSSFVNDKKLSPQKILKHPEKNTS